MRFTSPFLSHGLNFLTYGGLGNDLSHRGKTLARDVDYFYNWIGE
ncbi:MAG: hypothetical protein ACTSRK_18965 [Promethearchaeota archaeon]